MADLNEHPVGIGQQGTTPVPSGLKRTGSPLAEESDRPRKRACSDASFTAKEEKGELYIDHSSLTFSLVEYIPGFFFPRIEATGQGPPNAWKLVAPECFQPQYSNESSSSTSTLTPLPTAISPEYIDLLKEKTEKFRDPELHDMIISALDPAAHGTTAQRALWIYLADRPATAFKVIAQHSFKNTVEMYGQESVQRLKDLRRRLKTDVAAGFIDEADGAVIVKLMAWKKVQEKVNRFWTGYDWANIKFVPGALETKVDLSAASETAYRDAFEQAVAQVVMGHADGGTRYATIGVGLHFLGIYYDGKNLFADHKSARRQGHESTTDFCDYLANTHNHYSLAFEPDPDHLGLFRQTAAYESVYLTALAELHRYGVQLAAAKCVPLLSPSPSPVTAQGSSGIQPVIRTIAFTPPVAMLKNMARLGCFNAAKFALRPPGASQVASEDDRDWELSEQEDADWDYGSVNSRSTYEEGEEGDDRPDPQQQELFDSLPLPPLLENESDVAKLWQLVREKQGEE